MIKAVVFDFFGVICSDEYWNYVKADRQSEGVFRDYTEEVNRGDISWSDFVKRIAAATHTSVREVNKLYESEKIDSRMVNWIADLHNNYRTGLITNAHHEFLDPLLEKSHLRSHLDSVIMSSRYGVIKPNPEIFNLALEQLDVDPDEVVYMDDLNRHVAAAKSVGIHAFRFDNFKQAKKEFQQILLHCSP